MTVTDPSGRDWSIKQSVEGPVEVMHSRVSVRARLPPAAG